MRQLQQDKKYKPASPMCVVDTYVEQIVNGGNTAENNINKTEKNAKKRRKISLWKTTTLTSLYIAMCMRMAELYRFRTNTMVIWLVKMFICKSVLGLALRNPSECSSRVNFSLSVRSVYLRSVFSVYAGFRLCPFLSYDYGCDYTI